MRIERLNLQSFRSFEQASLELSTFNLFVGRNNSGKSSLLRPLMHLQEGMPDLALGDVRIGATGCDISVSFSWLEQEAHMRPLTNISMLVKDGRFQTLTQTANGQHASVGKFKNVESDNFFYVFGSKRKVTTLAETVGINAVTTVHQNFQHLNAKVDRLINVEFQPAHKFYVDACQSVLGFKVGTSNTNEGKRATYTVKNQIGIPMLSMGDGVMNSVALIADLAVAENKIFLIEEMENDLHPHAIKALCDLILENKGNNQFLISTHSNLLIKRIGTSSQCRIFNVELDFKDRLPCSTVEQVSNTYEARREILENLGYEFADNELWSAWIFFEESSAEKIVRQYLIPWFAPLLASRLRTFSARSSTELIPKFRDFNDLFVYLHLSPTYRNRVWVIVDAGEKEKNIIDEFTKTYESKGWSPSQFRQLQRHDFELYYPISFQPRVDMILAERDKQIKRRLKKELLNDVEAWIAQDETRAKQAFSETATELISLLSEISAALG